MRRHLSACACNCCSNECAWSSQRSRGSLSHEDPSRQKQACHASEQSMSTAGKLLGDQSGQKWLQVYCKRQEHYIDSSLSRFTITINTSTSLPNSSQSFPYRIALPVRYPTHHQESTLASSSSLLHKATPPSSPIFGSRQAKRPLCGKVFAACGVRTNSASRAVNDSIAVSGASSYALKMRALGFRRLVWVEDHILAVSRHMWCSRLGVIWRAAPLVVKTWRSAQSANGFRDRMVRQLQGVLAS